MKRIIKLTTKGLVLSALATPTLAEKWDMPMAYAGTNFHSEVGADFGNCVTEGTGGEIEIVTHPAGSLYPGDQIKRAVQTGQVPIGERIMSAHQNDNALYGVDSIPFFASSYEASETLWDIARPSIEEALSDENLKLLYTVPWPPQGIFFKDEVTSVEDMAGIKFRSFNNMTTRFAELTDMLPVSIEAAELSQALATGVASSMITSSATGYDRKVWESLDYYYEVDAWLPRNYVMVNADTWSNVTDENKDVILSCASDARENGLQRSKDYTQVTLKGLRDNGMNVESGSEQLNEDLREIGRTLTDEWLEAAGEEGRGIVEEFRAAQD